MTAAIGLNLGGGSPCISYEVFQASRGSRAVPAFDG